QGSFLLHPLNARAMPLKSWGSGGKPPVHPLKSQKTPKFSGSVAETTAGFLLCWFRWRWGVRLDRRGDISPFGRGLQASAFGSHRLSTRGVRRVQCRFDFLQLPLLQLDHLAEQASLLLQVLVRFQCGVQRLAVIAGEVRSHAANDHPYQKGGGDRQKQV